MSPLLQCSMNMRIVKSGIILGILLALGSLQGCFGLQRASGCNNPGIFGCKDRAPEPSGVEQPPAGLERAAAVGRAQTDPANDCRYREGHEYPWSRLLDDCMADGGTRCQCFASLPPDILEQFESFEAEKAAERRRQVQQRSRQPAFGVAPVDPMAQDCQQ